MGELTRWDPITRWNPVKELEEMEKRLATLFGRTAARKEGEREEAMTVAEWSPLVDISEDDKEYLIKAELPEVKKDQIKLTVHNGVMTISGERTYEKEEKGKKFHRVERAYGSFTRSFTVPDDADAAKISAESKDGVLWVHLPKTAKPASKSVEIKVG
ncbi:Heat shock protein, Hsp20 family [Nitrospira tepida]|uniref:Heat shock protein, Hsp20 family n=1 Tax=Nitrospira tepida TaxID=2973512 RepID=A0AA86T979_9BACT|nr:Hsp20/alpha crystallin family protein [Nitrospira tepida]CAI4033902.1 Heat shock protein, Hsp20 family [Nitrospira tepida]